MILFTSSHFEFMMAVFDALISNAYLHNNIFCCVVREMKRYLPKMTFIESIAGRVSSHALLLSSAKDATI